MKCNLSNCVLSVVSTKVLHLKLAGKWRYLLPCVLVAPETRFAVTIDFLNQKNFILKNRKAVTCG